MFGESSLRSLAPPRSSHPPQHPSHRLHSAPGRRESRTSCIAWEHSLTKVRVFEQHDTSHVMPIVDRREEPWLNVRIPPRSDTPFESPRLLPSSRGDDSLFK